MIIALIESDYGFGVDFTPETVEEVAQLARMAAHKSSEPAEVGFYFGNKTPTGNIWVKKVSKSVQVNSITKRMKQQS